MPKISVLMSCYNSETWLTEAIESILGQSFTDYEFIIVNDGSTDSTQEILSLYQKRDSRIRVISKLNTGLADSLNIGISHASGDWIARIDADDVALPNRLERQIKIATDGGFVFVGSGAHVIDEVGRRIGEYRYPINHYELLVRLKSGTAFPAHSSALIKTSALKKIGAYRTRIKRSQDWDLWLRLSEIGTLTSIQESLVMIRKHTGQVSHESGGKDQIIYSRVAITSYFLRQLGFIDPVNSSDIIFNKFLRWIDIKLVGEHIYDYYKLRTLFRGLSKEFPFCIYSMFAIFALISRNPFILGKLIRRKHSSEDLCLGLASDWILKNKTSDNKIPY